VTTLDRSRARKMEPRAPTPDRRIEAIARLVDAVQASLLYAMGKMSFCSIARLQMTTRMKGTRRGASFRSRCC